MELTTAPDLQRREPGQQVVARMRILSAGLEAQVGVEVEVGVQVRARARA